MASSEEDVPQYLIEIQDSAEGTNQEEMMVILDLDGQEMPESVTQAILQLAQSSSQPISQVRVSRASKNTTATLPPNVVKTEFGTVNDDGNVSSIKLKKNELQQEQDEILSPRAENYTQNIFLPCEGNIQGDIFPSSSETQILLPADEGIIQQHLLPTSETDDHVSVITEQPTSPVLAKMEEEVLQEEKNEFDASVTCLNSETRIIVKDLIHLEEFRTGKQRHSVCALNGSSHTEMDMPVTDLVTVYPQSIVNGGDEHNNQTVSHAISQEKCLITKKNLLTCVSNETFSTESSISVTEDSESKSKAVAFGSPGCDKGSTNTLFKKNNTDIKSGCVTEREQFYPTAKPSEVHLTNFDTRNVSTTPQGLQKISCTFCSYHCDNDIEMGRHLKVSHNDRHPFKCFICKKAFAIELSYKIHLLSHGDMTPVKKHNKPKTVIACPYCLESFTTTRRVLRHVCEVHPKLHVYFCNECKISFKSKLELKEHTVSSVHQDKIRKVTRCPICKVSCIRLTKHMTTKHPNYHPFLCDMCGFSCKTYTKIKIHQLTHISQKPFQCPHCHKFFKSKVSWSRHVKNHGSEKRFSCNQCSFRSNDSYEFKRHVQRVHSKNKYYDCKFCNLSFVKAYDLKLHAMSEHNSKHTQFCCYCNFSCETRAQMKQHRITHTGQNHYVCDKCGFGTAIKAHLERHQATHTDLKPFKCPECDYSCREKVNLKKHMVTHRPEKPFACPMCPHRCKLRSLLNSHIRIVHSSLRPFSCNVCNYTCKTASNLKKHQWIHQGYKPYACRFCPYITRETNKLRRHERFKHKAQMEEEKSLPPNQEVTKSSENALVTAKEEQQRKTSEQENSKLRDNGFAKGVLRLTAEPANEEDMSSTFFSSRVSFARLQENLSGTESLAFSTNPSQHQTQRFIIQFSE
ncbi:hypothetical protein EGW08_012718 [Elysia chlorotica]|uniref:C2H2-type domain-containing protein n=1 Tax=Elysia chlorotica TaxID=188477 RepID=A0A3S1HHL6_ELYCH|nr:hypothetical protein EGW08_012718 [Elysia chlorotica]